MSFRLVFSDIFPGGYHLLAFSPGYWVGGQYTKGPTKLGVTLYPTIALEQALAYLTGKSRNLHRFRYL